MSFNLMSGARCLVFHAWLMTPRLQANGSWPMGLARPSGRPAKRRAEFGVPTLDEDSTLNVYGQEAR